MRDPKRIERILGKIKKVWIKHPDWRLGQIISNAWGEICDIFYLEDDTLEKSLDEILKGDE